MFNYHVAVNVAVFDVTPDTSAVIFAVPPIGLHTETVTAPLFTVVIIFVSMETQLAVSVKFPKDPSV
jgi:hypothetical protein